MKVVYVAGKYNDKNIIDILDNMRRGIALAKMLALSGFAPYCPFLDYQYNLVSGGPLTLEQYRAIGMAFVDKADCMLVVKERWAQSSGTIAEIERASELGIPIYYSIVQLLNEEDPNGIETKDSE